MDYKHVCRFCKKSFPCGRSLGGHIRSHLIHNNTKNNKNSIDHAPNEGYELRENPKKTNKATKLLNSSPPPPPPSWSTESEAENGDNLNLNNQQQKLARRSSFIGGNNSHSSVSEVVEPEQEEVAIAMCLIMLSKDVGNWGDISSSYVAEFSDNVSLLQANKTKRRSRRETIQGKESVSGVAGNDHTKNKSKNFDFQASGYFPNGSKLENIKVFEDGFSLNDQNKKLSESKNSVSPADNNDTDKSKKLDYAASGLIQNGLKMKEIGVSRSGFASYDQSNKADQSKRKLGDFFKRKKKMESSGSGHVKNGSKMKEFEVSEDGSASNDQKMDDHELGFDENVGMSSESWNTNYKRSKFECTTCNKVFHSYQALGGHRASHKKLVGVVKGCPSPVSKLEGSEIANGDDFISPPHDHHHHQQQHEHQQQQQQQEVVARIEIGSSTTIPSSKKVIQKHECPICFRVFPSGQALGGHKRSHLLAVNNSNNSEKPETRDLLDLNLPPEPAEEETTATTIPAASSSNSLVELIKPYWWVETAKHEAILGLISN